MTQIRWDDFAKVDIRAGTMVLTIGFVSEGGSIVLAGPERKIPNGSSLL